jgi:hypothetical protein
MIIRALALKIILGGSSYANETVKEITPGS